MKKLFLIVVLGLLMSGNAYAEIIILKCVDDEEKHTLNPKIDTKNKTAITGSTKSKLFIGEDHYSLHGEHGTRFYINRVTGGYKWTLGEKVFGKGTCYRDPKPKF